MSRKDLLRKLFSKVPLRLLIIGIFLAGVITVAGNVILAVGKKAVFESMSGLFAGKITVGPAVYIFPNTISLHDIAIRKASSVSGKPVLVLKKVVLRLSLGALVFERTIRVSEAVLRFSTMRYDVAAALLEENFQGILSIIRRASGHQIKIFVEEPLLEFGRDDVGLKSGAAIRLTASVRDGIMEAKGYLRALSFSNGVRAKTESLSVASGHPLWYALNAQLKEDGLVIDRLIFTGAGLQSKLWGHVRGDAVKINGFAFIDTEPKESNGAKYANRRNLERFPGEEELRNVDMYILDIDGRVRLRLPEIIVDRLNLTLNNVPVNLQGNVWLSDPLSFKANLSVAQPRFPGSEPMFLEKADADVTGAWEGHVLKVDGQARIKFVERSGLSFAPESAKVDFDGLVVSIDRQRRPRARLSSGNIVYWTNDNEHKIVVKDFQALVGVQTNGLKIIDMEAPFYGGLLKGRTLIDSTTLPSKITSRVTLNDVDTDALEELLVHFAKFNGRMSSVIIFSNVPDLELRGEVVVSDGKLTNLNFFNWVGDVFLIPSLKAIDFARASAQFSIDRQNIRLRDIHLNAEDVRITGYYDVDQKNLVSSKLTLAFSKSLLGKSLKFKPILRVFEGDGAYLDFDFQLSGNVDTMNFQWLPTDVKKRIQAIIPDFIERNIERNVNLLMETEPQ